MNFHTNLVDADWIVYASSHSGEKKTIKAIEKQSVMSTIFLIEVACGVEKNQRMVVFLQN